MTKSGVCGAAIRDLQTLLDSGAVGRLPDGDLLERFVATRDEAAFEILVLRHGPMVWGVCRRALGDHHDAQDAFQATFLVLARRASSVAPRGMVGHWLHGVAIRTAMKARGMRAKQRSRETTVPELPEPANLSRPLDDCLALLDLELRRLPQKYRVPIVLCDLEGTTHEEAARQVGCPVGTLSGRLWRAREMLAKRIGRRGVVVSGASVAALLSQSTASAGVPPSVVASTVRAAGLIASGHAATGVISSEVAALTEGMVNAMLMTKLKTAAVALAILAGLAAPVAILRATDDPPAGSNAGPPRKANEGVTLKPSSEQKLKWGEPVNGLRMALAWPPSLGEPGLGKESAFYLVVQNVSRADVRLTANESSPNPRTLVIRSHGKPLSSLRDPSLMPVDRLLKPSEVAYLRLFQPEKDAKPGTTVGITMEESVRVFPQYTLTAEMNIEKAPAGAWTGKLATAETKGSLDVIPPKQKVAQTLYTSWTTAGRTKDGAIPGALIGRLGESVKTFLTNNPGRKTTTQLQKMLPRFESSRDWKAQDAVNLLDELAELEATPIRMAFDRDEATVIRTGMPLPSDLATAPWGPALAANGLRLAWLLEPRAAEYPLGTPLKSRILIHNAGKEPVVFRTRMWHQIGHQARDAKGAEIPVESLEFLTRSGPLVPFRLAPGEFIEVNAPGIGLGAIKHADDWQHTNVGTWIDAKAGDEATVSTDPVLLGDRNETPELDGEPRWWLDHIVDRLSRHLPFPDDKEARERLLYRIAIELFGTPVSLETNAAFVADHTPTALDSLAKNLFHRPGQTAWAGPLISANTKFKVLPVDPDAAKKPRVATGPGEYTLGEKASLWVARRFVDERIVNDARFTFGAIGKRHDINLPDGYNTWAAGWVRGSNVLWVMQQDTFRAYDFSDPANVKETALDREKVPTPILSAMSNALKAAEPAMPKASAPPASSK